MERGINRNQFKKNFLKDIIMRLDFQGVLQAEMEKILLEVKPYLKKNSFSRYNEKVNNKVAINGTTIEEATSQIVYSFMDENSGFTLYLSATSIVLSIRNVGYTPFEEYSDIFSHIVSVYKDKIDFLLLKDWGLEKSIIAL